jgi:hypothetical protein
VGGARRGMFKEFGGDELMVVGRDERGSCLKLGRGRGIMAVRGDEGGIGEVLCGGNEVMAVGCG